MKPPTPSLPATSLAVRVNFVLDVQVKHLSDILCISSPCPPYSPLTRLSDPSWPTKCSWKTASPSVSVSLPYSRSHYLQPGLLLQPPDLRPFSPSHFILWTVVQLKCKSGHALPLLNSFCDCTGINANVICPFHQSHPHGTVLLDPSQAHWGPDCSLYAPGPLCSHLFPPGMLWSEHLNGSFPHFFK